MQGMEDYYVTHPWPPACECGCHEPTSFSQRGTPNRFVNQSHSNYARRDRYPEINAKANETRHRDAIPIEDFRRVVKKIKAQKGWTWAEMARISGVNPGQLSVWMFSTVPRRVSRKSAEQFFRRLAGQATLPTKYERRQDVDTLRRG